MFKKLVEFIKKPSVLSRINERLMQKIDQLKILEAQVIINNMKSQGVWNSLSNAEFKVFSQFGDDGIIQYLVNHIQGIPKTFIEFGVQNYQESNTRFLLINNNWKGLVIDGSQTNVDYIKNDEIYWRYDLTAVNSFITAENINQTFHSNEFNGEIGILSIDIDGNDYWVWKSINSVNPVIVIVEYNSVFGSKWAITIPYDPEFIRTNAHFSNLYWGCSLRALCILAEKKGYAFIGSNSNGNNAYFVRNDKLGSFRPLTAEAGYVKSKFRESRDAEGKLSFISGQNRIEMIKNMPVVDIETGKTNIISGMI